MNGGATGVATGAEAVVAVAALATLPSEYEVERLATVEAGADVDETRALAGGETTMAPVTAMTTAPMANSVSMARRHTSAAPAVA